VPLFCRRLTKLVTFTLTKRTFGCQEAGDAAAAGAYVPLTVVSVVAGGGRADQDAGGNVAATVIVEGAAPSAPCSGLARGL